MQKGKFNIIYDSQWGSTGKGNISTFLAKRYNVTHASTTNLPNAGHTAIIGNPQNQYKFVSKILPACCVLNRTSKFIKAFIGPTAGFTLEQFFLELRQCNSGHENVFIHPRAMVVQDKHRHEESTTTKHIASTMQGAGAVRAEKLMRKEGIKLVRDYEELEEFVVRDTPTAPFALMVHRDIESGACWLHEGSQGFSLGINHGSHYPKSTSRECTPMQMAADMGVPHHMIGDVYMVMRPFPIRVGHVKEGDKIIGHSGGCYEDHEETSWEEITKNAGAPPEIANGELTTVTKRLRRVFTTSWDQIKLAAKIGGATKIALNFANYIDWSCYATNDERYLSDKVLAFIEQVEDRTGLPVSVVGTGPNSEHHVFER